jgi:hypothetical protein
LRPALAGIMGGRRAWIVSMISVLSMPCTYVLVTPRWACPSWRWMTGSGTLSRAISTAWAWRNWWGAKRRRTPATAARRSSARAPVCDHARPHVVPQITHRNGPTGRPARM